MCWFQSRSCHEEKDIYEEYLTQREIQHNINLVNGEAS